MDIQVLSRQGLGIKAISRKLGISRNTVRKYLKQSNAMPAYKARSTKPSKLDAFKPYLLERIAAAKPHWIPGVVLLREAQEQGYSGGITVLREFILPFKQTTSEPLIRFETEPGVQMQIDFTTIRRGRQTLKAFVATLGYSRATYVQFFDNEKEAAWIEGITEAFHFFEGVPKELLCDNAKAIIIERDAYAEGEHRWNNNMLQLSKDYGFRLKVCRPYRAKTKGKVERFNHYLKNSFITPLAARLKQSGLILDAQVANGHIGPWLQEVAHQRIHGTTEQKPQVLLDNERHHLLPLPNIKQDYVDVIVSQTTVPIPYESFQHPLSSYAQLHGSFL